MQYPEIYLFFTIIRDISINLKSIVYDMFIIPGEKYDVTKMSLTHESDLHNATYGTGSETKKNEDKRRKRQVARQE